MKKNIISNVIISSSKIDVSTTLLPVIQMLGLETECQQKKAIYVGEERERQRGVFVRGYVDFKCR